MRPHVFASAALSTGIVLLLVSRAAFAQGTSAPAEPPPGPLTYEHNRTSERAGERGRSAAQKKDYAACIEAFDEALLTSVDPVFFRDRGICHDRAGHRYPAIDDYRQYLFDRPEAPDSDSIRERLHALEADVGVRTKSEKGDDDDGTGFSVSVSTDDGFQAEGDTSSSGSSSKGPKRLEDLEAAERRADEADESALRRGSGWVIGPYFGVRRWGRSGFDWGQTVGMTLGYSIGKLHTFRGDLGYTAINASGGTSSLGGLMLFGGYELRIPLDDLVSNALVLGGGFGYERPKQSSTGLVWSIALPRGRFGYRHVFGASFGLEIVGDAGMAILSLVDAPAGAQSSDSVPVFGGTIALVVGF